MTAVLMKFATEGQPIPMASWTSLQIPSTEHSDQSHERRSGTDAENDGDQCCRYGPDHDRHSTDPFLGYLSVVY